MSVKPTVPSVRDQPPLSPTPRTTLKRHADRASSDRRDLYEVLDAALICHLGVVVDGAPVILPTAFGVDLEGPDEGGTLYLHGSVASASLRAAPRGTLCVTFTLLDGLVLARSGFHHSMNYRSAVVIGVPRLVDDEEEKRHALDLVVDHAVPGRSSTLRTHTRKELAATSVIALSLAEASVKARSGVRSTTMSTSRTAVGQACCRCDSSPPASTRPPTRSIRTLPRTCAPVPPA